VIIQSMQVLRSVVLMVYDRYRVEFTRDDCESVNR
jgi:hypothetical protein